MIKNEISEFNFLEQWDKHSSVKDSTKKANELIRLHFLKKGAASLEINHAVESPPQGKIRMDWDAFLRTMCNQEINSIIYEYAQIASKKNQSIPLNLLVDFIQYADRHCEFAENILTSIGECGHYLILQNPAWQYLSLDKLKEPFSEKESEKRIFLWKRMFAQNSNHALAYILEHFKEWTEKELMILLDELKFSSDILDELMLESLKKELKPKLKNKLYSILFCQSSKAYIQDSCVYIHEQIKNEKFEQICALDIFKDYLKIEFRVVIQILPPSCFLEESVRIKFLDFLVKKDLLVDFTEAIARYRDSHSAELFCRYLIDHKLFNEEFPVEKLSKIMDYKSFNTISLFYLRSMKEEADLEAFLFFIKYYKHFWSDELVMEVIQLSRYKKLDQKFNLEVFYDFIPYRMNPNSNIEFEIPAFIKETVQLPFTFSAVINFRKILRK
ncbi:MAG: DUF5691 domain-containing protein [Saprospiraceae bacterium]